MIQLGEGSSALGFKKKKKKILPWVPASAWATGWRCRGAAAPHDRWGRSDHRAPSGGAVRRSRARSDGGGQSAWSLDGVRDRLTIIQTPNPINKRIWGPHRSINPITYDHLISEPHCAAYTHNYANIILAKSTYKPRICNYFPYRKKNVTNDRCG